MFDNNVLVGYVQYMENTDPFVVSTKLQPQDPVPHCFGVNIPLNSQLGFLCNLFNFPLKPEDAALQLASNKYFFKCHMSIEEQKEMLENDDDPLFILRPQISVMVSKIIDKFMRIPETDFALFLIKLKHTLEGDPDIESYFHQSDGLNSILGGKKLNAAQSRTVLNIINLMVLKNEGLEHAKSNEFCLQFLYQCFDIADEKTITDLIGISQKILENDMKSCNLYIKNMILADELEIQPIGYCISSALNFIKNEDLMDLFIRFLIMVLDTCNDQYLYPQFINIFDENENAAILDKLLECPIVKLKFSVEAFKILMNEKIPKNKENIKANEMFEKEKVAREYILHDVQKTKNKQIKATDTKILRKQESTTLKNEITDKKKKASKTFTENRKIKSSITSIDAATAPLADKRLLRLKESEQIGDQSRLRISKQDSLPTVGEKTRRDSILRCKSIFMISNTNYDSGSSTRSSISSTSSKNSIRISDINFDTYFENLVKAAKITQKYPSFKDLTEEDDFDSYNKEEMNQLDRNDGDGEGNIYNNTDLDNSGILPPPICPPLLPVCAPRMGVAVLPSAMAPQLDNNSIKSKDSMNQKQPNNFHLFNFETLITKRMEKRYIQLFWDEIQLPESKEAAEKTIWNQLEPIDFNIEDIKTIFEIKRVNSKIETLPKVVSQKEITALDQNRVQAVGIILSKLAGINIIKQALLEIDLKVLTRDTIEKISFILPTEAEKNKIEKALKENPGVTLNNIESFMLNLSSIPDCEARVRIWKFIINYDTQEKEITNILEDVHHSIPQIMSSKLLRAILYMFLTIGNALNRKKSTKAFKLDYLQTSFSVKDNSYKRPLLYYICEKLMDTEFKDSDLYSEIRAIAHCSKHDYNYFEALFVKIKESCQNAMEDYKKVIMHSDRANVNVRINNTLLDILKRYAVIIVIKKRIKNRYLSMLDFFGYTKEEAMSFSMDSFFQIINNLSIEYRTYRNQILSNRLIISEKKAVQPVKKINQALPQVENLKAEKNNLCLVVPKETLEKKISPSEEKIKKSEDMLTALLANGRDLSYKAKKALIKTKRNLKKGLTNSMSKKVN